MNQLKTENFIFKSGQNLKDFAPAETGGILPANLNASLLDPNKEALAELQDKLYAFNKYGVLIILQAIDAAGKDSLIKHVMSAINPQGCQVKSFKKPSSEELSHDYLWRCSKYLPARGNISIFNRSYYEEVIIVKLHPKILENQNLPKSTTQGPDLWEQRYEQINNFEKYLVQNGFPVLKFFLNLSKEEQKNRFLRRINKTNKNWKFSIYDLEERKHWEKYQSIYDSMLKNTSTEWAPWHVIPADNKWFARYLASEIIVQKLKELNLSYPEVNPEMKKYLKMAKKRLMEE